MKPVPILLATALLCAPVLTACSGTPEPKPEAVLEVQPVQCECPKQLPPPPDLMKRPTVKRFLPQT